MTVTAEIVSFALVEGTTDAEFLAAAQETEAFVRGCPGFLSRSLCKGADGRWTDYLLWASAAEARAAAAAIGQAPGIERFMTAIDGPSVEMRHCQVVWQMAA